MFVNWFMSHCFAEPNCNSGATLYRNPTLATTANDSDEADKQECECRWFWNG